MREYEAPPKSLLIKRHHSFKLADWSASSSAKIHKITLDTLAHDGEDPAVVIQTAAKDLECCLVVSNAPSRDGQWLKRLCDAGDQNPPFEVSTVANALEKISARAEIPLWLAYDRFHEAGLKSPNRNIAPAPTPPGSCDA